MKRTKIFSLTVVYISMLLALIVSTILVPAVEGFVSGGIKALSSVNYKHDAYISIYPDNADYKNTYSDAYYEQNKEKITGFVEGLTGQKGNISMSVFDNIGDGSTAEIKLFFALNEKLFLPMEENNASLVSVKGAYVGNGCKASINDNRIRIFNEYFDVLGIASTKKLEKNNCVYLKYGDLSAASKQTIIKAVFENFCYGEPLTLKYESNNHDLELLEGYLRENGYTYEAGKEEVPDGYTGLLGVVKNVIVVISLIICILVIMESVNLLLSSVMRDACIKEIFGMKRSQIYRPVFLKIIICYVLAAITSLAVILIIYGQGVLYWAEAAVLNALIVLAVYGIDYFIINKQRKHRMAQIMRCAE